MGANSRQWSETMRQRLRLDLDRSTIERAIVDGMVDRYRRDGPPLIDGARQAVERIAADYPVAVASSSHRDVIDAALRGLGLESSFGAVVSSDEVAHGKPAPDVFLEAARRLGIDPVDCLVVEDSLNGVRAARSAGMRVVLVPNASVPPAPGTAGLADAVLETLGELDPAAIEVARSDRPGPAPSGPAPSKPAPSGTAPSGRARPAGPAPARAAPGVLPGPAIHPVRRLIRYWLSRTVAWVLARSYVRPTLVGRDRLPAGPAIYCFNHLNWTDPFILMAALPFRPRLYFFGPKEEDMTVGGRNRLMTWTGTTIPYRPGKNDLLEATRRVSAVIGSGGVVAIAGEGRIHASEREILPLSEGAAYFAIRSGVPLVPLAINGSSWLRLGRRVRVRVGEPLAATGRPSRESVDALTAACWSALHEIVRDEPELARPGPVGRWVTELFNDWPEGRRPAVDAPA